MLGSSGPPRSAVGGIVKTGLNVDAVPSIETMAEPVTDGRAAGDVAPIRLWLLELDEVVSTSGLCE